MKPVFVDYAYNGEEPLTEHSRWRLREEVGGIGDHGWEYLPAAAAKGKPQSNMNKYWLGIPLVCAGSLFPHPYRPFHRDEGCQRTSPPPCWGNWGFLSGPEDPS